MGRHTSEYEIYLMVVNRELDNGMFIMTDQESTPAPLHVVKVQDDIRVDLPGTRR